MKYKRKIKQLSISLLLFAVLLFTFTACGASEGNKSASAEITVTNVLGDFESTDMDGNAVDKSIFSDKTLTMVNIWGTFCDPCIKEMPDLGEINREYADKGFQVVGIPVDLPDTSDSFEDYKITTAKDIIASTKADYLHIMPSPDLSEAKLNDVDAVPETIFVDKDGNQVGESYLGSRSKDDWTAIIDALLVSMNK